MLIFPFVAHYAGETPVFLGYFVDNDMQVRRLCASMLHHRIRDCADQRLLLQLRPPSPHLYRHDRHIYDSSSNIFSIRSRMPSHWLAPTVTGARLPSPRPQTALRPSRFAASKSTPPGGAAKSTTSADLVSRDSTFSPTTRVGTVEKSKSRREAIWGSSSNVYGVAPATNAAARCSALLATTAARAPSATR